MCKTKNIIIMEEKLRKIIFWKNKKKFQRNCWKIWRNMCKKMKILKGNLKIQNKRILKMEK